jgi:hypothetical protein
MASRLSELLERIRPAGTPGSAEDRVARRAAGAAEELAALRAALDAAESDADEVVASAQATAATWQQQAELEAQTIRDGTADRAATEAARAAAEYDVADPELDRIRLRADDEVEALRAQSDDLSARLSQQVVADLWSLIESDAPTATGTGDQP